MRKLLPKLWGELREVAAGVTPSSGFPRCHSGCQGPALTFKNKLTAADSCPQRPLARTWRSIWSQVSTQGSSPTSNFLSISTGSWLGTQPWVFICQPRSPREFSECLSCHTACTPDARAWGPPATQVTQPGPCRFSLHQPGSKSRWGWPEPRL